MDIDLTDRVRRAGDFLGIPLIDHVIVGGNGYTSLLALNWTQPSPTGGPTT